MLNPDRQIRFKTKVWSDSADEVQGYLDYINGVYDGDCVASPVLKSAGGGWHGFITVFKREDHKAFSLSDFMRRSVPPP